MYDIVYITAKLFAVMSSLHVKLDVLVCIVIYDSKNALRCVCWVIAIYATFCSNYFEHMCRESWPLEGDCTRAQIRSVDQIYVN